jgi:thiol-disulfide isomerase/thioredoxin
MNRTIQGVLAFSLMLVLAARVDAIAIGARLDDLFLKDLQAYSQNLKDYRSDRGLCVVFFSVVCPTSRKYIPHLSRIHEAYEARGIRLVAVNANYNESAEEVRAFVVEQAIPFVVLRDPRGQAADFFGAKSTPHAFLFDADLTLLYNGEIDDGFGIEEHTTSRGLWDAMDALVSGSKVAQQVTRPFGCAIRRRPPGPDGPIAPDTPTFNKEVSRLLQKRCQDCHREGGIGRVPFITYENVRAWAIDMRDSIRNLTMPPWPAKEGYGNIAGSRRLSEDEIGLFSRWVDAGMPEGDPEDRPPDRTFKAGWTLGEPDLVMIPDEPYEVEAVGQDEYRCFVMPLELSEERFVSGIEVLSKATELVHHVSIYTDGSGKAMALQNADPRPGYSSFGGVGFPVSGPLGGWAPGNTPFLLPEGVGRALPKRCDIVMQIHYHKSGKAEIDHSRLGIYLTKKPVDKLLYEEAVASRLLFIPAGAQNHRVHGSITITRDEHALAVLPHMHLLGSEIKISATYPDGQVVPLVWANPWDFDWQETYIFKEPVPLPRGTRISLDASYDNSTRNPRNPNNPPKFVRWGEESSDEMCIAFLFVTRDDEHLLQRVNAP